MAKRSRVPFGGDVSGEMEFTVAKGEVKVKGTISTQPWGEVAWSGVKNREVGGMKYDNFDIYEDNEEGRATYEREARYAYQDDEENHEDEDEDDYGW